MNSMVLLERAVCPAELAAGAPHTPILRMLCVPRQTVRPNWRGVLPRRSTAPRRRPTVRWRGVSQRRRAWAADGRPVNRPMRRGSRLAWFFVMLGIAGLPLTGAAYAAAPPSPPQPPPWCHRRPARNSSLSKRDLNGEHRVGIAQKLYFQRDILAYIYCWLRPFASISLVRIGTSLVG